MEGFRRNFDMEIVEAARRAVNVIHPKKHQPAHIHRPAPAVPAGRHILVAQQPQLLAALLAFRCAIKPRGDDWQIEARNQVDLDAIVELLKLNGVHGVLRHNRPGDNSGRREPLAP